MKYVYGPVKSRRLGFSLGISIIPRKICDFDCLYCQLGATGKKTKERREYVRIEEVLEELKGFIEGQKGVNINYITLSGSGEPTLNIRVGELIQAIKKISTLPVAVITNSSLLIDEKVRQDLLGADLIVPSLDAVAQNVFEKINRPLEGIRIEELIQALIKLRREFKGRVWLEVMLVKGINDRIDYIRKLKEVIEQIRPDKIHLNSPVRTPAEANILPVDKKKLEEIKETLGDKCEII